jgi:Retrotransposon gag protein
MAGTSGAYSVFDLEDDELLEILNRDDFNPEEGEVETPTTYTLSTGKVVGIKTLMAALKRQQAKLLAAVAAGEKEIPTRSAEDAHADKLSSKEVEELVNRRVTEAVQQVKVDFEHKVKVTKPKPKPSDPAPFIGDGNVNVKYWLNEVNTYLDYFATPEHEKVALAESYLKSKARQLWENIKAKDPSKVSWSFFVESMKDAYWHINPEVTARIKIDNCLQGRRSVQNYAHHFTALMAEVPSLSPADAIWRFYKGLDPTVRDKLPADVIQVSMQEGLGHLIKKANDCDQRKQLAQAMLEAPGTSRRHAELNAYVSQGRHQSRKDRRGSRRDPAVRANKMEVKRPRREPDEQDVLPKLDYVQLTAEEKNRYRREGRCFVCGQTGHKAVHCPSRKSKKLN